IKELRSSPALPEPTLWTMTLDDQRPDVDVRCPSCGARSTPGADWCTLCFADLRPEPAVEQDRPEFLDRREEGEERSSEAPSPPPVVDAMLAELAARERPTSRLAGLMGAMSSTGARVAVMLVGTLVVTAAGFGLMAALGSLL
ncbi:MAG: hypothetical protein ACOYXW_02310, partial [Actinomycetota bacterium]